MISEANPGENQETETQISIPRDERELPKFKCHKLLGSLLVFVLVFFVTLVMVTLLLALCAIGFCCGCILCVMAIPLLVVSYLVVRLLQLLTNGDAYYNATHVKALIRLLMLCCIFPLLVLLAMFYLLALKVSKIKQITLYHLSISHWIQVTCIIIGLSALSFTLSDVLETFLPPMLWQYERGINAAQAAVEIIDCLILWLARTLVLKRVPPPFKQHHVLGLATHKWIQVVIFLIIGIDTISFSCHLITYFFYKYYKSLRPTLNVKPTRFSWMETILHRTYAVYWADGLRKNIIFIFSSTVLFVSSNSYFRTHFDASPEDKKVQRFGTMAFASLFILAALWLIKSCILLSWKAKHVYVQLRPQLIENREELFFLGILGRHKFDILSIEASSPLTKELFNSIRLYSLPQPFPRLKIQSTMTAFLKQYISELFKNSDNSKSHRVSHDERDEDKYHDLTWSKLTKMILYDDCSGEFYKMILYDFVQFVRSVVYPKLSETIRDDLYIWKSQEDVQKDQQEDVQDVQAGGSEILCATLYDLQKMAQYFQRAQPTLSDDKYVPDMLHYLTTSAEKWSLEEYLEQLIKGETIHQVEGDLNNTSDPQKEYEWDWFKKLMYKQSHKLSSKEINKSFKSSAVDIRESGTSSFNQVNESPNSRSNETQEPHKIDKETLKAWLENARGTCMELANTVSSAEEVVNCLDNVISGLLIGATFIMWLLLTGLATTKILVIIVSPLLAATFIFGETCKSLFQGIIFVYVRHPFNVGNLVIIEDKMMVVKIVGIWQTIFVGVDKSDEVIYSNSELANKMIINYKSDFDWNDRLEFGLKSLEIPNIETLTTAIKKKLSKDEKCSSNHISIEALATEEDVNVIVHLKYNTENLHGMTLYERVQEKHNLRSLFCNKIWDLLKEEKEKISKGKMKIT